MVRDHDNQGQILAQMMGCKLGVFPMTYLGLPLSNKSLCRTAYLPLLQKFNSRLAGWVAKNLSIAGRLVLINSVLTALPIYHMAIFKLPKWVIKEIDKTRRRFLWHGMAVESHKLNLVNWKTVCMPKELGGLGVIDLSVFNNAMLMKLNWQWFKPEVRLWKSIFNITNPGLLMPNNAVDFSIMLNEVCPFFNISVKRIPENGTRICFWQHDWGFGILKYEFPSLYSYADDSEVTLKSVINAASFENLFRSITSQQAAQDLRCIRTNILPFTMIQEGGVDDINWKWTTNGDFKVKSAYFYMKQGPMIKSNLNTLWKLQVPPRMKVFEWLLQLNKILTIDNLVKRGWLLVNRCILCKCNSERVYHLFSECSLTTTLYDMVDMQMGIRMVIGNADNRDAVIIVLNASGSMKEKAILVITHFVIWRERCCRIFRESERSLQDLLEQIKQQWRYSCMATREQH